MHFPLLKSAPLHGQTRRAASPYRPRAPYARLLLVLALLAGVAVGCTSEDDPVVYNSEGSAVSPVTLEPPPVTHSGAVGGSGNSYYEVAVGAGTTSVSLSGLVRDGDLYCYSDAAFSTQTCESANAGIADEAGQFTCASECTLYLRVAGFAANGTAYSLTVSAAQ